MSFEEWLEIIYVKSNGEKISEASIQKYSSAIGAVSKDMQEDNLIDKNIEDMDLYELDIAIEKILNNTQFIIKDTTGNRMYSCALKRYRCYRYFINDLKPNDIITAEEKITEKEAKIKIRIGQQNFKNDLINKYNGKCIITNLSLRPALIASHIKPWAVSTPSERVDVNNGLLLSATYDKLFDSGLITFKANGEIIVSNIIDDKNLELLNIKRGDKFNLKLEGKMGEYLKYHNDVIFVK